jgi:hypothetical protein
LSKLYEPKDSVLHQKLKQFTVAATSLLKNRFDEGKVVPVVSRYQFRISNGKFVGEKSFAYPLFETFIASHQEELTELTEFRSCLEYCKESEIFQKHLSQLGGAKDYYKENIEQYLKSEYLFVVLSKLLHSVGGIKFDETEFDKLYCQIESYLNSPFMHLLALVPLENFEFVGKEIVLEEDTKISAIENSELDVLINFQVINADMASLPLPPCALKTNFIAEKDNQINYQIPFEKIQNVLRIFRIFKKGALWYEHIYCIPLSWEPSRPLSIFFSQSTRGSKYFLEEKEGKDLLQIWKNLENIKPENRFVEIAIERFDKAALRQKAEDKLTDYIAALEALFLGSDEKAELEYRLALRVATFVGGSAKERICIRRILKSAYAQRSCIVHGKKLKTTQIDGKRYSIDDLAVYLEDYTRKSLQKFLTITTQRISHEKLLDELDDAILAFNKKSFDFKYTTREDTKEVQ